jgi:UDP-N-acetylmuramyl pentapeptide phosphotransferase/UDP-N-acetylglucosamine-1-phosphate transferase
MLHAQNDLISEIKSVKEMKAYIHPWSAAVFLLQILQRLNMNFEVKEHLKPHMQNHHHIFKAFKHRQTQTVSRIPS